MSSNSRFDSLVGKTILRVEHWGQCVTDDEVADLIFTDGTDLRIDSFNGCNGAGAGLEFNTYTDIEEGEITLYAI